MLYGPQRQLLFFAIPPVAQPQLKFANMQTSADPISVVCYPKDVVTSKTTTIFAARDCYAYYLTPINSLPKMRVNHCVIKQERCIFRQGCSSKNLSPKRQSEWSGCDVKISKIWCLHRSKARTKRLLLALSVCRGPKSGREFLRAVQNVIAESFNSM
jgi:hypothetical protein